MGLCPLPCLQPEAPPESAPELSAPGSPPSQLAVSTEKHCGAAGTLSLPPPAPFFFLGTSSGGGGSASLPGLFPPRSSAVLGGQSALGHCRELTGHLRAGELGGHNEVISAGASQIPRDLVQVQTRPGVAGVWSRPCPLWQPGMEEGIQSCTGQARLGGSDDVPCWGP